MTHTKLGIANIAILKEVFNDIISLSRQEQVCLVRVRFKRYFLEKLPHSKYFFMTILTYYIMNNGTQKTENIFTKFPIRIQHI